jgi:hypothetical protein
MYGSISDVLQILILGYVWKKLADIADDAEEDRKWMLEHYGWIIDNRAAIKRLEDKVSGIIRAHTQVSSIKPPKPPEAIDE